MTLNKIILLEYLKRLAKLYTPLSLAAIALSPIYLITKNLLLYLTIFDTTLITILPYIIYSSIAEVIK